jgi:hypothetical protein
LISVVLLVVLVVLLTYPRQTTVYIIEAVDGRPLERASIEGFGKKTKEKIRAKLLNKLRPECGRAFDIAGLRSPERQLRESGLIIQPSKYLYDYSARELGLISEVRRRKYMDEFATGQAQAGTVPHMRYGKALTDDGIARIYLHDSAFLGDSFLSGFFGWLSLDDVLTHEMIHAGGQPPTPGWLGSIQNDLAGYEHYQAIMEACR